MTRVGTALLADESGFIVSAELVMVGTIVVLGATAALVGVRDAVSGELADLANSIRNLDQSYYYRGMRGCQTAVGYRAYTAGSSFLDSRLHAEPPADFVCEDILIGTAPCAAPAHAAPLVIPSPGSTCLAPPVLPTPCPAQPVPAVPCPTPCPTGDCPPSASMNSMLPGGYPILPGNPSAAGYPYPYLPAPALQEPSGPAQVW